MFGTKDIHYEGLIPFITHGILSPASVTLIIGFLIAKYLYLDNKKISLLSSNFLEMISNFIKQNINLTNSFWAALIL